MNTYAIGNLVPKRFKSFFLLSQKRCKTVKKNPKGAEYLFQDTVIAVRPLSSDPMNQKEGEKKVGNGLLMKFDKLLLFSFCFLLSNVSSCWERKDCILPSVFKKKRKKKRRGGPMWWTVEIYSLPLCTRSLQTGFVSLYVFEVLVQV